VTISQRIFFELKNKGKKQKELAEYTGISTSAISAWNKNNTNPAAENLSTIADFLGVSLEYLITGKEKSPSLPEDELELLTYYKELPEREQMKLIGRASALAEVYKEQVEEPKPPIISINCSQNRVSAGIGEELFDYEQWDTVDVIETPISRKADFMLIVDGESMSPKFHDGDYVLVRQQPAVELGQIGIFYVDGKGYVKKYDGDYLISLNPDYDDIYIVDKESRCFGLVLGIAELAE
jgi:phage repressor protein C with HTH and peptisase S24 domain